MLSSYVSIGRSVWYILFLGICTICSEWVRPCIKKLSVIAWTWRLDICNICMILFKLSSFPESILHPLSIGCTICTWSKYYCHEFCATKLCCIAVENTSSSAIRCNDGPLTEYHQHSNHVSKPPPQQFEHSSLAARPTDRPPLTTFRLFFIFSR